MGSTAALLLPGTAQAALQADQLNHVETAQGVLSSSFIANSIRQVQTVTAGVSGLLAFVELQIWTVGRMGDFRLSLYDGDFAGAANFPGPEGSPGGYGTLIGSINVPQNTLPLYVEAQLGHFAEFDVRSLGFHIVPGQVFSLLSEVRGSSVAIANGYYSDPADPNSFVPSEYAGGYNSSTRFDANFAATTADRGFLTIVEVADVPEPSAWAIMLCGLALCGSALRRQRRASSSRNKSPCRSAS